MMSLSYRAYTNSATDLFIFKNCYLDVSFIIYFVQDFTADFICLFKCIENRHEAEIQKCLAGNS